MTDAPTSNLTWDVAYGTQDVASNTLVSSHYLRPGETETTMIRLVIGNDFKSEDNETFTVALMLHTERIAFVVVHFLLLLWKNYN